ncbi:hypothetical protein ACVWYH_003578 [Bradyrhizobium sp. GM24.11]
MRKGFAGRDIAGEIQKRRTRGVLELGIGDDHVEDRLRLSLDVVPGAERLEEAAAGCDDRGRAGIAARPNAKCGIGDDDGNLRSQPLAQRQCERQARKRAAANDNATLYRHVQIPGQFWALLADLRWAKQCGEARAERPLSVIPGRATREPGIQRLSARDSGFALSAPGMTRHQEALPCPKA